MDEAIEDTYQDRLERENARLRAALAHERFLREQAGALYEQVQDRRDRREQLRDALKALADELASIDLGMDVLREAADEIEQLRQDARDFAEQLTEKPEIIDYACAECVPDYADILPGFRCARHRAQAWLSAHPAESKEGA